MKLSRIFSYLLKKNHCRYKPPSHPQHDLALVKVSKPLSFSSKIMPICLPFNEEFPDERGIVYVAGWAESSSRTQDCATGDKGPDPFSKCKFPFFINQTKSYISTQCIKTKSPSHGDKGCQELYKMVTKRKGSNASLLDKRVNTKVVEGLGTI